MSPVRREDEPYTDYSDSIPDRLIDSDKEEAFIEWLTAQPIDPQMAKYIGMSWCNAVGVAITIDIIDEFTSGRAAETRG